MRFVSPYYLIYGKLKQYTVNCSMFLVAAPTRGRVEGIYFFRLVSRRTLMLSRYVGWGGLGGGWQRLLVLRHLLLLSRYGCVGRLGAQGGELALPLSIYLFVSS